MQIYGELILGFAFVWSLAGAAAAFIGVRFRRQNLIDASRYSLYALTALFWASALLLSYAFLSNDFGNKYVAAYSDRGMATIYRLAAFWGGEQGALLFWVTSLTTFAAISVHGNRKKEPSWIGTTIGVLLLCIGFFELLMIFESNPFATYLTHGGPADGQGMNPLLQNPTMVIHPPSLLTGYITFTIPFAYGLGALIVGKLDTEWIRVTRFWTIVSWLFLTVGLVLGGAWAYEELGWGGFWMWDPVENAGFIPWLTATAFLHSVMIQERRGMLMRWNAILVCLTFFLTVLGTFLTRSQLIASVHAFVDSPLTTYFLGYLAVLAVVSTVVIGRRWRQLRSEHHIESFWSRESFFILNNVVLVGASIIVIWGTIFPKLSDLESFRGVFNQLVDAFNATLGHLFGTMEPLLESVDLGEPWFNKVMVPLGLVLLFLTAVGPLMPWRRTTVKQFRKIFLPPILWALLPSLIVVGWIATGLTGELTAGGMDLGDALALLWSEVTLNHVYGFLAIYLGFFVVITVAGEFVRSLRIRRRAVGGSRLWNGIVLFAKARRRFGGYAVHIGIVLCFWAFAGNAFKTTLPEQVLHPGDVVEVGDYRITLARIDEIFEPDGRYVASRATMVVRDLGDPVDRGQIDALASTLEARKLTPASIEARPGHAKLWVRLQSDRARQDLLAAGLILSELRRNYVRMPDETAKHTRVYRFRHEDILRLQPTAFMRHIREIKGRVSELADLGVEAKLTQGSTVVRLIFRDAEAFAHFTAIEELADELPEVLNVQNSDEAHSVEIIPVGLGRILTPEVRFYEKHSTPTTETAIESHAFEDLYLAMRPAIGKPYISLPAAIVFPLVSFLWLGTIIMVLGSFIALLPGWAVATITARRGPRKRSRPAPPPPLPPAPAAASPRSKLSLLLAYAAGGILLAAVVGFELARAGVPAPAPPSNPLAPALERLYCPDREGGSWVIREGRTLADCPTSEGEATRALLASLAKRMGNPDFGDAHMRTRLFRGMVAEDRRTDRLLRVPMSDFNAIWHQVRCLCGCSHILFQCGLECGPAAQWKQEFRQMLTAGVPGREALDIYIDFWNARRPATAAAYTRDNILKDPGKSGSWVFPMLAGGLFVLGLLFVILRRGRQAAAAQRSGAEPRPALPEAPDGQDDLIDDLLGETQGPLG